jgi:signal transduction histidine kinase
MIVRSKAFYLFLGFLILLTALALYNLSFQPALPFHLQKGNDGLSLDKTLNLNKISTTRIPVIIAVDGIKATSRYDIESIIDSRKIGDKVKVDFSNGTASEFYLIPHNDFWYVFLMGFLGFSFLVIAVIVWEKRRKNYEKFFTYAGLLLGFNLAMSRPGFYLPILPSFLLIISFYVSYSLALVAFLYFSFHFPAPTFPEKSTRIIKRLFLVLGLIFSFMLILLFSNKNFRLSHESISLYHSAYRLFRAYIFLILFVSLTNMLRNHKRKPNPVNRRKLQWVLWGIFWGTFPFIFLWDLPHIFNLHPFMPDWLVYSFMLIIPLSIAIAMLRYRLFDIEIVLSRSLIYSSIIIILIGVYAFSVGGLSLVIYNELTFQSPILSIFAAMIVGLIFNPLRSNVQSFVNKKFFRISFDRFMSLQAFTLVLENALDVEQVCHGLQKHFHMCIPLNQDRVLFRDDKKWRTFNPKDQPSDDLVQWLQKKELCQDERILVNIRKMEKIEKNLPLVLCDIPLPWIVAIPMGNNAVWFLGEKKSGMRFWKEDLDLAVQMAKTANQRWEKLNYILQKQKEVERIQAAKMESLRRLVAGVAHEINNPIGAISGSSDVSDRAIIKLRNILDKGHFVERQEKQLAMKALAALENSNKNNLVASERVAKIVTNLKKFARLDEAEYQMASINECIESAIGLNEAEVEGRISIKRDYGDLPEIYCSPSSMNQVFMALFKNSIEAIKETGEIVIRTFLKEDHIVIEIIDNGLGIPPENLRSIFDVGFTTKGVRVGVGLGLSICYIIIVAEHKGFIDISSELNKGTTVTITLPAEMDYEEDMGIS